ncbi:MAG TPA: MFS transporter, partial [Ktedonobacteraceae bacterium]|nr:MFS transporter [Ktedonobacteraceae bacterium]
MYTLEDDRETSEILRKRQLLAQAQAQNGQGTDQAQSNESTVPLTKVEASATAIESQPTGPMPELRPTGRGVGIAALTIACIGVFFTALDQTVVVTALPAIINNLNVPLSQLDHAAWIVSAYLLGFIIAMPLMGRVSDIYGRRLILLLCLSIFGVGSIFCALAPELGQTWNLSFLSALHIDVSSPGLVWLIAARFFQAIGGGAIVPIAMAIASDFYGKQHRGLALGIIGGVTEAGGALGPLYGALIVQHSGWQTIFYLNVPIVVLVGFAAWFFVPKGVKIHEKIDWLGALLLGVALTCLSLGLSQQGASLNAATAGGQGPQNNLVALLLSVLFFAIFVVVEIKVRWPVVDLSLFKRLPFSATSLVSLLVGAALIIALADIPIYVDTVLQLTVLDSGLALLRLTMMIPIGALIGGWLCGKLTCRVTGLLGLLFTAGGFYLMSLWPATPDWNLMTSSTLLAGFGFGLVISPISTTATNAVRAGQVGMSSAIVTALRMVGMMLGLAALTSWALTYFKQLAGSYNPLNSAMTAEQFARLAQSYTHFLITAAHTVYSSVFFFSMILCLIALVPALGLWGRQSPEAEPRATIALAPEGAEAVRALQPTFTRQKTGLFGGGLALLLILSCLFVALVWGHGESLGRFDATA